MPIQDLPGTTPRWADNPVAAPPTTITEPTETEKSIGYQPGNLRRQHTNWFFNLVYQWLAWLKTTIFRTDDFFGDQALPGGTAPGIGSGLSITAGSFSARVYADGYQVELSTGPNRQRQIFTLPASPNNSTMYRIVINSTNADYTTDASATQAELRTNMIAAINSAVGSAVTAAAFGNDIEVVQDIAGVPFSFSIATGPAAPITIGSSVSNYVYAASSDTYWDLHRSGGWVPVIVAAMASAPAVTAHAVRVYMVRTDGADRTAVTDYRRSHVAVTKAFDVTSTARFTTDEVSKGLNGTSSLGILATPRRQDQVDELAGHNYQFLHDLSTNGSLGHVRVYARTTGTGLSLGVTYVWGAYLVGASSWVSEKDDVYRFDWNPIGGTTGARFFRKTGIGVGTSIADSAWDDELAANTTRLQLPLGFGLKLGGAPMGQGSGADANLTPILELIRNAGGATRTLVASNNEAPGSAASIVEYLSVEGGVLTLERVYNATWDDDAQNWVRTTSGIMAWRETMGRYGVLTTYYIPGDASPFTTSDWHNVKRYAAVSAKSDFVIALAGADSPIFNWSIVGDDPGTGAPGEVSKRDDHPPGALYFALNDLPQGALITGINLRTSTTGSSAGANEIRVAASRTNVNGTCESLMSTSPGYDLVTPHNSAMMTFGLTLDAADGVRTIDHSNFVYAVTVCALGTSHPVVRMLEVFYRSRD